VAALWNSTGTVRWDLNWRRRFFEWENNVLDEFLILLNHVTLSSEEDTWEWRLENGGSFSVKSTYCLVSNLSVTGAVVSPEAAWVFKVIWKCPAPSKVSALLWKLLHDRMPTKVNLFRRRITQVQGDQVCSFCGNCAETSIHLLLYCDFALGVWRGIHDWLGLSLQFPHSFQSLFNSVAAVSCRKQIKQGLVMVWGAVIWAVWFHRNQIVFENGRTDTAVVIDNIKTFSWKWWMGRPNGSPCLLYEWMSEPLICMATG
jgi:hypothetical protein